MTKQNGKTTRRGFLGWGLAMATTTGALTLSLFSFLRMPLPVLTPDKNKRFKIGTRKDFSPGVVKYFEKQHAYVFEDSQGMYAISAVCTHLGCIVMKEGEQYICPCHGANYTLLGEVTKGPAPKGLNWFKIELDPTGKLYVDKNQTVKSGTKFQI